MRKRASRRRKKGSAAPRWIIAGAAAALLLLFVAWQVPAGLALRLAGSGSPGLSWSSASGTAWRGRAENVYWQGVALGRVEWRMIGIESLPDMRTRWALKGESPQYRLDGRVTLAGGEPLLLEALRASLPAAWVDLGHALPLVYLTGTLDLDLERMLLRNGLPVAGHGTIRWRDAGLGGLVREALGEILVDIAPPPAGAGEVLLLDFESVGRSDVGLRGSGRLQDNDYLVELELAIAPGREDLYELIGPLGRLRPDGTIDLQWQGKLFPEQS